MPDTNLDKLIDAAFEMRQNPAAIEKTYTASYLLQCTLPHSDPGGDLRLWTRKNRNRRLTIVPYVDPDTHKSMYPYGALPRLLLYWIVTEAAQKNSRTLYLGDSLTAFIHKLKLDGSRSGGKRSVSKRLRSQMTRLLMASITLQEQDGARWERMEVSTGGHVWWTPDGSAQGELFDSHIVLGELFFQSIIKNPVPVDRRALLMLKRSSLALDLYGWVAMKTWQANHPEDGREGYPVTWEQLYAQMGSEYSEIRDFKKKVLKTLVKVKQAYPKMKIQIEPTGILVLPAPTPVPERELN